MMPPADRIQLDPGHVASESQDDRPNDFQAVGPALRILQLNVEGLSASKPAIISTLAARHNVDVVCLEETHVDTDKSSLSHWQGLTSSAIASTPSTDERPT